MTVSTIPVNNSAAKESHDSWSAVLSHQERFMLPAIGYACVATSVYLAFVTGLAITGARLV